MVFEYLMITVLLLNTFFLLVTTQVQSNGRRVMTHKEIRSHYCKNELLIDLVSTVSERSPSVRSPVGARWSYFGSYAPSRWPIRRLPRVQRRLARRSVADLMQRARCSQVPWGLLCEPGFLLDQPQNNPIQFLR